MDTVHLKTPYYDQCDLNHPWPEYPRPNLIRDSFLSLNGLWDYAILKKYDLTQLHYQGKICVPFCVESLLSQVGKKLQKNETLIYHKSFHLPSSFIQEKVILHFEAVSQFCKVYLNGKQVFEHQGAYLPFEIDITSNLKENNELIVTVTNPISILYPYGKQTKHPGGAFYTPCSGIWQSVWLESVSKDYIQNVTIDVHFDTSDVTLTMDSLSQQFEITIFAQQKILYKKRIQQKQVTLHIDEFHPWSCEDPFLYQIEIKTPSDKILSYFAFRKVTIEKYQNYPRIFLNNQPYFNNGLLDQGYFSDGLYAPATLKAYEDDILKMKSLGFNTLRKHIKIEPRLFYYLCDKLGMLVWQDMVNNGTTTYAPEIPHADECNHKNPKSRKIFIDHSQQTIALLKPFPSIILWTIFNEGWGQFCSQKLYQKVKKWDPTRIIDTTSGWVDYGASDVKSLHIYFHKIKWKSDVRPITLSEFGGYAYQCKNHIYSLNKTYGYKFFKSANAYQNAILKLYEKQIIPAIHRGLCACIYTQLSDVEEETNGLLTYDRQVLKVNADELKSILKKLHY